MEGEERKQGQDRQYACWGVLRAQQHGRENGIEIGTVVAHPDDRIAYILESVDNGEATVFLPADAAKDGVAVRKTFTLEEIFDVNLARDFAATIKCAPQIQEIKKRLNFPNKI